MPYFYGGQQQQIQPTTTTRPYILKGRPVTSFEEVKAAGVDFDGTISFFPDLANGKIYTKQCNIDGTAAYKMYEYKEIPMAIGDSNMSLYVTHDELKQVINDLKEALQTNNAKKQTSIQQF